jgi:hypothetical protein
VRAQLPYDGGSPLLTLNSANMVKGRITGRPSWRCNNRDQLYRHDSEPNAAALGRLVDPDGSLIPSPEFPAHGP